MNKTKKFFVAILSLFLLVSCSSSGNDQPTTPSNPEQDDPEAILDDLPFKPTNPIDFTDKVDYYNDHISKVKPNFELFLCADPNLSLSEQQNVFANPLFYQNAVHIRDNHRNHQEIDFTFSISEGNTECSVKPAENSAYIPGRIYIVTIDENSNICFKNKAPDIKKLTFDVEREDTFKYAISKDLKYFNISKVLKEAEEDTIEISDPGSQEAKDWFENHTYDLIYSTDEFSSLKAGDNFCVCPFKSNQPTIDDKLSYFGKFVSLTKVNNGYKVTYKNVDLHEIYKDENGQDCLDIHLNEKPAEKFQNVVNRFDKEEYKKQLIQNKQMQTLAQAMINVADDIGDPGNISKYDVLTMVRVDASFSWKAPKHVIQVKATANVPINKAKTAAIYVEFAYQYINEISCGAGYDIEYFLGVPYWINVYGNMTEHVTNKFTFKFGLMRDFAPSEQDTSDMSKMIKNAYKKLEEHPDYLLDNPTDEYTTNGNEIYLPICYIQIPFGGVFAFQLEADIHITLDLRVLFEYNYISEYTKRSVSFTSDDGVQNTSNTESMSSSCHSIDILGEIGVKAGLMVKVGLCITGLGKIFGFGVIIEAGVYLDIKGMVGLTWGTNQDTRFIGGIDLDFGLYGQLSGYLDILFFHPKYDFVKKKRSLIGYSKPYSLIDLLAPSEIELTEERTHIDGTNILQTKVFSVGEMQVDLKTFETNTEIEATMGDSKEKIHPLSLTTDSPYITIDNDHNDIVINPLHPAEFTAELKVTGHESLTYLLDGAPLTKTVSVHYRSPDAHSVTVKDASNTILTEKNKTFKVPEAHHEDGLNDKYSCELSLDENFNVVSSWFKYDSLYYDFEGFTDGENIYHGGETITVKDKDIVLTPILKEIVYHTATFYNGKGEVIKVSRVREFTDAVAPTTDEIMEGMEGYTFYGWDRAFNALSEDIEVYGIYYKVGE